MFALPVLLDFGLSHLNFGLAKKLTSTKLTCENENGVVNDCLLSICFQDLSSARYSGHLEHYESVTETRSFSSKVAPPPPERSFSQGHHYGHHHDLGHGQYHDPHSRERSIASRERERSTSRELSAEKESR